MKYTTDPNNWEVGDIFFYDFRAQNKTSWTLGKVKTITKFKSQPGYGVQYDIIAESGKSSATWSHFGTTSLAYEADAIFKLKDDPYRVIKVLFQDI